MPHAAKQHRVQARDPWHASAAPCHPRTEQRPRLVPRAWQQHVEQVEGQMQSSQQALGTLKRTLEETRLAFIDQQQVHKKLEALLDTMMARVEVLRASEQRQLPTKLQLHLQQEQQVHHHHHQQGISPKIQRHLEMFEKSGECCRPSTLSRGASQELSTLAQERRLLELQAKLAGKVSSIVSVHNLGASRSVGNLRPPGP